MLKVRFRHFLVASLLLAVGGPAAYATIPPKKGVKFPEAFAERRRGTPTAFTYSRSLMPMVKRIQANRAPPLGSEPRRFVHRVVGQRMHNRGAGEEKAPHRRSMRGLIFRSRDGGI